MTDYESGEIVREAIAKILEKGIKEELDTSILLLLIMAQVDNARHIAYIQGVADEKRAQREMEERNELEARGQG